MRLRSKIGAVAIVLAGIGIFFQFRSCDKKTDSGTSAIVLTKDESEAVIVDPRQHKITLVTKEHTKTFTLPDRPSRVSVLKEDGIKIVSPQYGTEFNPFLGVAYTLHGGVILGGLDLFYWKRLDVGMGLSVNPRFIQDTGVFLGFSYVTYSNTSVGLGLDNHVTPMVFVKVRL